MFPLGFINKHPIMHKYSALQKTGINVMVSIKDKNPPQTFEWQCTLYDLFLLKLKGLAKPVN